MRSTLPVVCASALLLAVTASVRSDDGSSAVTSGMAGTVGDTEARQTHIQSESQQVVGQLDAILAEYKQHGMENRDDVKTLQAIRGMMLTMSVDDMKQVIVLLQQARQAGSADAALHQSAAVSAAQGKIVSQLKGLLQTYAREEQQYDLAERFGQLAKRQGANLLDLLDANRTINYSASEDAAHDIITLQHAQQDQLSNDVHAALDDLAGLGSSDDPSETQRMNKAMDQAKTDNLAGNVTLAAGELAHGHIFQASSAEKLSRDSLREITRLLLLPTDDLSRMEQALKDLDQVIADQTQAASDTHAASHAKFDYKQVVALERAEGNVADDTDQVRKNLDAVSPQVQDDLGKALTQMQAARLDLKQQQEPPAAVKEDLALAMLQKAKADLTQQVEKAEKQDDNQKQEQEQKDAAAIAKALEELARIILAQQKIGAQTDVAVATKNDDGVKPLAPDQATLAHDTQVLKDGLPDAAADAVAPLGDAKHDMDQATVAQAMPSATDSVPPEHQALVDLMKARELLAKKEDQLNQDLGKPKDDDAALADASEKLDKAMQETDSAKDELQQTDPKMADLQHREEQIAQQLKQMEGDPKLSAPALQQAQAAANQAAQQLAANDPAQAADSMHQAAQAMQDAEQPAKGDAQPPAKGDSAQSPAMPGLVQKQQQLEQEAKALAQQAAQQLADADKQVGDITANDKGSLPPDANQALQDAQHDLSQASAQAQAGQNGQAQKSAQAASQAMAQAKAAMAMAQGKGGPGNQPGKMPGDKPGKTNENMAMRGKGNRKEIGHGTADGGPRRTVASADRYLGLPARDRAALLQSRSEKYSPDYAPQIEQYLQNLAEDESTK